MRDNVKLIRTGQDNKQEIITIDLNKAGTVLSPYYQLQQNDIIYVTPNKTKAKNWMLELVRDCGSPVFQFVVIASLLLNILNKVIK